MSRALGLVLDGIPLARGRAGAGSGTPGGAGTPTAPTILTFVLEDPGTGFTVTWDDNSSDETGFEVRILYPNGVTSTFIVGPGIETLTHSITGGPQPGLYSAQVSAFNAVGYSAASGILTDSYDATAGDPPTAPTIGTLTINADGSFVLTWTDNSDDETSFLVMIEYPTPIPHPTSPLPGQTLSGEGFTAVANATSYSGQLLNAAGINQVGNYKGYVQALEGTTGWSQVAGPATDAVGAAGVIDTFNRANNAALGTTSDGSEVWTETAWSIAGNAAAIAVLASGINSAVLDLDTTTGRLKLIKGASPDPAQEVPIYVIGRYVDDANFVAMKVYHWTGAYSLVTVTAGVETEIDSGGPDSGAEYDLEIGPGNAIKGYLDDVEVLSAVSAVHAAADKWGMAVDGTADAGNPWSGTVNQIEFTP